MRAFLLTGLILGCGATEEASAPPARAGNTEHQELGETSAETRAETRAEESDEQGEMPLKVLASAFSQVEASDGRRRYSSPPGSGCMVELEWWRPIPQDPGPPMVVASTREVQVLGEIRELSLTSTFNGVEQEVQMLAIPADGVHSRTVFRDCGDTEIDLFLSGLSPLD